ncbi:MULTISPECIES: TRAP transporter small permease [unclassified Fredinandcohnia]|uniref:TRAP transporter small permease n=1 Tax=unclassified Fredinandcohnia TaxID=2837514 RepID=UPI0030FD33A5
MERFKKIKSMFDNGIDNINVIFIALMTVIVAATVFTRYFFSYTPRWSSEVSMLLLVWVSFIGIAVGFRDKLHIGVGALVALFPKKVQTLCDIIAKILVIIVAIIFIVYGIRFTTLMGESTMAGTGLPQSVLYAAIPVSGILMLIYGIELLFKKGMHQEWDEQIEE